jgi:putative oxidoreductase
MSSSAATIDVPRTGQQSKGLHIALWVAQGLLGLLFAMAGAWKTFTPIAELAQKAPWVADAGGLVRFIGLSELLGGLGLILPAATRIQPRLTVAAAAGLTVVMVLAAGFHAMKGELQSLPVNIVLGGLAAFIAWGRWKKAPIAPR